jgi:HlyD family secretion protein
MMKTENQTTLKTNSAFSNRARKRGGQWRKLLLYLFGVVFLAAIVAGFWPKPIRVETSQVTRGPLTVSVLEEGKTRIRHRYVISPPVSGYLNRVTLRAGAAIQAGKTVLATIEAEASGFLNPRTRAETQARVKSLEAIRMQRAAEVDRAKAALELSKNEFARADALNKLSSTSLQDWDAAKTHVGVLGQELRSAEFALRAAEFEVEQARATLKQILTPGTDGSVPLQMVAPVDGFILNVYEENARSISVGTTIMEIGDLHDLEAEIELLSSDAVAVAPGAEVSIEQWGGGTPMHGRVSLVEPGGFTKISALGVEEQRVKVRVDFIDPLPPNNKLGDRYRVEARIVTWHGDDALQIPTGALFRRSNDWMTFVVKDSTAHLQKIDIAHNNGIAAEVSSGLTQAESVILYPPDNVKDGAAVTVDSKHSK